MWHGTGVPPVSHFHRSWRASAHGRFPSISIRPTREGDGSVTTTPSYCIDQVRVKMGESGDKFFLPVNKTRLVSLSPRRGRQNRAQGAAPRALGQRPTRHTSTRSGRQRSRQLCRPFHGLDGSSGCEPRVSPVASPWATFCRPLRWLPRPFPIPNQLQQDLFLARESPAFLVNSSGRGQQQP
jgi:hypothetical protein